MQRFLITSEKFTGTGEVWYNFEGLLCHFDLTDCAMNYAQVKYLLENISSNLELFKSMLSASTLQITEVPFQLTLDAFKREYPYSRNFHLLDARWPKLTKKEQVLAFFRAKHYRSYCERNSLWYKPMIADTWLSRKEFLNDWRKM